MKMLRKRGSALSFVVILVCGIVATIYIRKIYTPKLQSKSQPEYTDMPMVYMYEDGYLKHVPNFCKWTPEYLCAAMTTETGPMPVYVHHIQKTDTSSVSGALFNKGVWEKRIVDVFLRELKKFPGAGVLDFGCNVGSFAFLAARMGRKVVAVDAVMDNMLKVCKTVVKNELTKQVVMVVNAVYEDHRTVVFDTSNTNTYELSKIRLGYHRQGQSVCEETSRVQTVLMDDLLPIITFKTAVMKIDVESFEYFALNGAKKLFQEIDIQAILMEWYHVARTSKGQMLVDLLKGYGYVPYSIPENGLPGKLNSENYRSWTHDVLFLKS